MVLGKVKMSNSDVSAEPAEMLKLVGEIYKSILVPENFISVLELWDKNISSGSKVSAEMLDLLEDQLTTAIPLLEVSLKSVVNEDELVNRLAEFDRPSLLISTNGTVIGSNPGGRVHFNLREGDKIDRSVMQPADVCAFDQVVKQANKLSEADAFKVFGFTTTNADGSRTENLVACRSITIAATKMGYILLSVMDLVLSDHGAEAFQRSFGATEAEMRIIRHLIAGRRQTDIAGLDNIRDDTVKKHIKSLREKTQTPNTTALICLAASFAQISAEYGKLPSITNEPGRSITNRSGQTYVAPARHKLTRVNGLTVEYIDEGPANGEPLLILHSSMVGFVLPPEFISELNSRGYRVIVPFRPGNGISDPLPGPYCIDATSNHILAFAKQLGLEKFSVVGGTTGFVFAAHLAGLAPEKVRSIIGIAGYLPIEQRHLLNSMARYQRAVLYTRSKNRKLAKFLVLSGYKAYLQLGAHRFMSQIMQHSKADLRVINNSNALAAISVGLKIGGAQGVDALLDDTSLILTDWTPALAKVRCPIHLFHGDDDSVYKPELVREFCAGKQGFELTVLQNTGQLMIYDNPVEMARRIIAKLPQLPSAARKRERQLNEQTA